MAHGPRWVHTVADPERSHVREHAHQHAYLTWGWAWGWAFEPGTRMDTDMDTVMAGKVIPFEGNYSEWLKFKGARLRQEEAQERALAKRLSDELQWIKSNPKGQRGKNKARLRQYDALLDASSDARHAERVHTGAIAIAAGPRLTGRVLTAEGVSLSYGERQLFSGLNFELPAGAIMGVIGANGTGKTSLLKLIAGEVEADEGSVRLGPSVKLGYASQMRDGLDDDRSVYEEIAQGVDSLMLGGREVNVRAYVAAFNLKGAMQEKRVGSLSGGERGRVHLAKTLRDGCNLLLLDEPSNDLDVDTLRSLEEVRPPCICMHAHVQVPWRMCMCLDVDTLRSLEEVRDAGV